MVSRSINRSQYFPVQSEALMVHLIKGRQLDHYSFFLSVMLTIKKMMDSQLKFRGSVSAGMTGKIEAKSALKWLFHSPDLGVSMVRIIHFVVVF